MSLSVSCSDSLRSPSLFSSTSTRSSSAATEPDASTLTFHDSSSLPSELGIKSTTINLPLVLPQSPIPLQPVDVGKLHLDPELQSLPIGLVLSKLQLVGRSLLKVSTNTKLDLPPVSASTRTPELPRWVPCHFPAIRPPASSSINVSNQTLPPPSHVLAVVSADSPRTLMVPVHGLLYAKHCRNLHILSSSPRAQPFHPSLPTDSRPPSANLTNSAVTLPVVKLQLPHAQAFTLLHAYIYTLSRQSLFSSLLPTVPSSKFSNLLNPTLLSFAQSLSNLERQTLLRHLELVHGLWQICVALGVCDEKVWEVMRVCWSLLVGAVGIQEQQKKKEPAL
ncbi:hypothetical protein ACM66B_006825 [Microbotryomycetes sp. NB124-2]